MASMRLVSTHDRQGQAERSADRLKRMGYKVEIREGYRSHAGLRSLEYRVYSNLFDAFDKRKAKRQKRIRG